MYVSYFTVKPTAIVPSGITDSTVLVGEKVDVILTVGIIKPEANIFWVVDGTRQETTKQETNSNDDGTFNLKATYTHTFTKDPARVNFSYVIIEGDIDGTAILEGNYKTVDVYCE